MRCREVRAQLGIYRELSLAEEVRLREHVNGCPECAASWAAYQAQDRLLCTLAPISPSLDLDRGMRSRIAAAGHPRVRLARGQVVAVTLALLVFFSLAGRGVVSAAAGSLPGDYLYPVKRMAEQISLAVTLDPGAHRSYQQYLEEMRREEVREITRLERQVRVQFRGCLERVENDVWMVGGIAVIVDPAVWPDQPPLPGREILIEAVAVGGQLAAYRVAIGQESCSSPGPAIGPRPSSSPELSPSPVPSATAARQSSRTPRVPKPEGTATGRGGGKTPTAVPSSEPPASATPARMSRTPGHEADGTPGAETVPRGTPTPGGGYWGAKQSPTAEPPSGPTPAPTHPGPAPGPTYPRPAPGPTRPGRGGAGNR